MSNEINIGQLLNDYLEAEKYLEQQEVDSKPHMKGKKVMTGLEDQIQKWIDVIVERELKKLPKDDDV